MARESYKGCWHCSYTSGGAAFDLPDPWGVTPTARWGLWLQPGAVFSVRVSGLASISLSFPDSAGSAQGHDSGWLLIQAPPGPPRSAVCSSSSAAGCCGFLPIAFQPPRHSQWQLRAPAATAARQRPQQQLCFAGGGGGSLGDSQAAQRLFSSVRNLEVWAWWALGGAFGALDRQPPPPL